MGSMGAYLGRKKLGTRSNVSLHGLHLYKSTLWQTNIIATLCAFRFHSPKTLSSTCLNAAHKGWPLSFSPSPPSPSLSKRFLPHNIALYAACESAITSGIRCVGEVLLDANDRVIPNTNASFEVVHLAWSGTTVRD